MHVPGLMAGLNGLGARWSAKHWPEELSARKAAPHHELRGVEVRDRQGDRVGRITDAGWDPVSGELTYITVGIGLFGRRAVRCPGNLVRPQLGLVILDLGREALARHAA